MVLCWEIANHWKLRFIGSSHTLKLIDWLPKDQLEEHRFKGTTSTQHHSMASYTPRSSHAHRCRYVALILLAIAVVNVAATTEPEAGAHQEQMRHRRRFGRDDGEVPRTVPGRVRGSRCGICLSSQMVQQSSIGSCNWLHVFPHVFRILQQSRCVPAVN